jgi:hypothetical protein
MPASTEILGNAGHAYRESAPNPPASRASLSTVLTPDVNVKALDSAQDSNSFQVISARWPGFQPAFRKAPSSVLRSARLSLMSATRRAPPFEVRSSTPSSSSASGSRVAASSMVPPSLGGRVRSSIDASG